MTDVTLQLNLANGTFTILDATLKDTSFPNSPIDTLLQNGMKFDFYGCALSGKNQITCMAKIVAINQNVNVNILGDFSKLFDNLSNEYETSTVIALDKAGIRPSFKIIQGIPVEVKFIYNNINPAATAISLYEPSLQIFDENFFSLGIITGRFTDIDF